MEGAKRKARPSARRAEREKSTSSLNIARVLLPGKERPRRDPGKSNLAKFAEETTLAPLSESNFSRSRKLFGVLGKINFNFKLKLAHFFGKE